MLKNYFITAFRNLRRNRVFAFINIVGLALGIAVFLLISEYVAYEWGANRFHKNFKNLYRTSVVYKDGNSDHLLPPGFAPIIKQRFSGIESLARVADGIGSGVITISNPASAKSATATKSFSEANVSYVDGSFLGMFTFPLVAGTKSLDEPQTMAISETLAKKYFGSTNAVGKIVMLSNQFGNTNYTITAVLKDIQQQSDIKTGIFLSLATLNSAASRHGNDWADPATTQSGFSNIFLQLKPGVNASILADQVTQFVRSINPDSKEDKVALQPFSELHLAPSLHYPLQTFGSLLMVLVFTGVAVLILLIAWINYINLSTAQALNRAREVGVRKVLGATRFKLILQYLTETLLLTLAAVALAFVIVLILQNLYNSFTGKDLSLTVLNQGWFWYAGVTLILAGSLLSGGYVAFVLSSFKPIKTIRGKIDNAVKGFTLRKSLVVFQFTVSIVFIISTIVLYRQLGYMRTQDLGMNIKQLLVLKGPTVSSEGQSQKTAVFNDQLAGLPFISKIAGSNNIPGQDYNFTANGFTGTVPQPGDERKSYSILIVDNKFFDAYSIKLVDGRNFTEEDVKSGWEKAKKVIINQKAAAQFGFRKNEPVAGKKILWGTAQYEVIGVIQDYHHQSLRENIPASIYLPSVCSGYFTVQTGTDNMQSKISTLKTLYEQSFPGNPFEYFFADEHYDQQYATEQKLGSVFIASALVAVFIACLGLFGLTAFAARQRVKEIGIRKVLGAGISDIATLLSKDFLVLVVVSIVIASPVAWWAMSKWLQDFAYRTSISWWMFVLAGCIAIFIALATISFLAVKAAMANPVKSLRTE